MKPTLDPDNYFKCELCEEVFEKGWTDEEAHAEMLSTFGDVKPEDRVTICEDCNEKLKVFMQYQEHLPNENDKIH